MRIHVHLHLHLHLHIIIHIHMHIHIHIYIYILVEEGEEGGDKPNHVTLRSVPQGLLKLNSFIRHSE